MASVDLTIHIQRGGAVESCIAIYITIEYLLVSVCYDSGLIQEFVIVRTS